MLDIEAQRQLIQDRLDKARSAAERNRLGQFATPPQLALEIARYTSSLWRGARVGGNRVIPRSGHRQRLVLLGPLARLSRPGPSPMLAGSRSIRPWPPPRSRLWEASGLRILAGDFTRLSPRSAL